MTHNSKYKSQKQYWQLSKERRVPSHPIIRAFAIPKIKYINKTISNNSEEAVTLKNLSVLDIGCGNGFFTYYLEEVYNTFALDFSKHMLDNNGCRFKVCGSAEGLPFRDNSFDIAFCSNLLHHVDSPQKVVSEMARISKKYIILSEPNRNNPLMFMFGLMKKVERGTLKFSLKYMKNLVVKEGLKIISATIMGSVLPNKTPMMLLPYIKKIDGEFTFGFYTIIVAKIN